MTSNEVIINHEQGPSGGRFVAYKAGKLVGEMTYTLDNKNVAIFDHTFVDESVRGQNLGRKMLDQAAYLLRNSHTKMIPVCSYVKKQVENNPDLYADLLEPL